MESIQDGLREEDIPLSGIDFHCSNILQQVLEDNNVYSALIERCRDKDAMSNYLQRAVWKYRSSINSRLPLSADGYFSTILPCKSIKSKQPDEVFVTIILPVIDRLSSATIKRRLAKCVWKESVHK